MPLKTFDGSNSKLAYAINPEGFGQARMRKRLKRLVPQEVRSLNPTDVKHSKPWGN